MCTTANSVHTHDVDNNNKCQLNVVYVHKLTPLNGLMPVALCVK